MQIVCIDFDLTIASYSGWHGEGYVEITGIPLPGAKEAIKELRNSGYLVLIHSTRCGFEGGLPAIVTWLGVHNIVVDGVCLNKPNADYYIDDKGITFNGDWSATVRRLKTFKHWQHKKERKHVKDKRA